ncbi:unnamed protein product [Callosobruchus maculatus]|uniref:Pre-C2HC domain-containing protein n=1 Tax=Callosobruchus maculatus TaxID=64391 RepID=A0A653D750_CALMS|nr:unnamed protein product [Callosobruchus maculatus]
MECDSTHTLIERKLKNREIHMPNQYALAIKEARRKPFPLDVHYVTHDFFMKYDDKNVYTYQSIRPGRNVNDARVADVKTFKYCPDGKISYKLSYEDEYVELPCRSNAGNSNNHTRLKLYDNRIKITEQKFKHLQELTSVLSQEVKDFYASLPYDSQDKKQGNKKTKQKTESDEESETNEEVVNIEETRIPTKATKLKSTTKYKNKVNKKAKQTLESDEKLEKKQKQLRCTLSIELSTSIGVGKAPHGEGQWQTSSSKEAHVVPSAIAPSVAFPNEHQAYEFLWKLFSTCTLQPGDDNAELATSETTDSVIGEASGRVTENMFNSSFLHFAMNDGPSYTEDQLAGMPIVIASCDGNYSLEPPEPVADISTTPEAKEKFRSELEKWKIEKRQQRQQSSNKNKIWRQQVKTSKKGKRKKRKETVMNEHEPHEPLILTVREENIPHHTFPLPSERNIHAVIRGIPTSTTEQEVKGELEQKGYDPQHIIRLKRNGGVPMPLVVVILPKTEKSQQVFNEHEFLGLSIRVEVQKNSRLIKTISEAFNVHFVSIGETYAKNIIRPNTPPPISQINQKNIFLNPITPSEVINIISSLKNRKVRGVSEELALPLRTTPMGYIE